MGWCSSTICRKTPKPKYLLSRLLVFLGINPPFLETGTEGGVVKDIMAEIIKLLLVLWRHGRNAVDPKSHN